MFTTASLAARIEHAECGSLKELAAVAAERRTADVFLRELGGGVATYLAPGSPTNKLFGLGFAPPPAVEELAAIEDAFAARGAPLHAEVSSLADPSVGKLLTSRGYQLIGFENVLGLALRSGDFEAELDLSIQISPVGPGESQAWMEAVTTGFLNPDTFDGPPSHEAPTRDELERVLGETFAASSFERILARQRGSVAGGASLRLQDGVALLAGAATVPEYRRRGVQTAMLRYRLREAARRGCDVAAVTTQPGSKSTDNVQRFGFAVLYVRAILLKTPGV
jgi:GNAT superfamily N-acetyltransferase